MNIVNAYLRKGRAKIILPDEDMEYRDGYYFYKTSNCFMLYPILWWQDQSGITINESTPRGTVTHSPSEYKETTYPNHWGLLYFSADPILKLQPWWNNPPRLGAGVRARNANYEAYLGKAAFFIFANRVDALMCLKIGKINRIVARTNYQYDCYFNAQMRGIYPTSYACWDKSDGRQWHTALSTTHELILSNVEGSVGGGDSGGTLFYVKNVED